MCWLTFVWQWILTQYQLKSSVLNHIGFSPPHLLVSCLFLFWQHATKQFTELFFPNHRFGASWQEMRLSRFLLTKVSLEKTFKCFAVSCLISCHLVYCVVDSVETCFFCKTSKVCFALSCTVFCSYSHFKIFLC